MRQLERIRCLIKVHTQPMKLNLSFVKTGTWEDEYEQNGSCRLYSHLTCMARTRVQSRAICPFPEQMSQVASTGGVTPCLRIVEDVLNRRSLPAFQKKCRAHQYAFLPISRTSMLSSPPYTSHHDVAQRESTLLMAWIFCMPNSASQRSSAAIPSFA